MCCYVLMAACNYWLWTAIEEEINVFPMIRGDAKLGKEKSLKDGVLSWIELTDLYWFYNTST